MDELSYRKRVRVDSVDPEFNVESTKIKKIRDDLLSLLDDSEVVPDRDSASQDLDSVIRSFEEVIESSGSGSSPAILIDLTDDTEDVKAETKTRGGDVSELVKVSTELPGLGEFWDFQNEFASYDSFGLGLGIEQNYERNNIDYGSEYVALDGIFDYSDVNFGSDFLWRPDTLPAL